MKASLLTKIINHVSNTIVIASFTGMVGYLLARAIKHIDPRAGLVCGAAAGAIGPLFFNEGCSKVSIVVGVAALIFLPCKLCEMGKFPLTFKASLAMTTAVIGIAAALVLAILRIEYEVVKDQEELEQL